MTLTCFIAMAFEREDTDLLYMSVLKPTLKRLNINAVRIDKLEHNDDIDDRIIEELNKCNFAIADLTYARPSVYFEAGYAQCKVPVIYTCRADHFKPKTDDPFGNLRVHFDLQMKNIIPWTSPLDQKFSERLSRRIHLVTIPLRRQQESGEKLKREISEFSSQAIQRQLQTVLNSSERLGLAAKYRGGFISKDSPFILLPTVFRLYNEAPWYRKRTADKLMPLWLGRKQVKSRVQALYVYVTPSLTKSSLELLEEYLLRHPIYDVNSYTTTMLVDALIEHLIICSLQPVSTATTMSVLHNYAFDSDHDEFTLDDLRVLPSDVVQKHKRMFLTGSTVDIEGGKGPGEKLLFDGARLTKSVWNDGNKEKTVRIPHRKVRRQVHVRTIAPIQSRRLFEQRLSDILNDIDHEYIAPRGG